MISLAQSPSQPPAGAADEATAPPLTIRSLCCVGAGYVGGPTAAVMAFNNPQVRVTVADLNTRRIRRWNSRHPPIYEPGLRDIVRVARDGTRAAQLASHQDASPVSVPERQPNLFFTTDVAGAIAAADAVMIAVNTPTKSHGVGAGVATDMTAFETVTGVVAQHTRPGAIIVEKSTVPVRTAKLVLDTLALHRPGVHFEVVSNPEFLAAGTAVRDLLYPDRILVGADVTATGQRASEAIVALYAAWVPRERIITMNVFSSELAKLVANAMLAQRISSINSISAVCEATGADVDEVARAIGCDPRIGDKFLRAGIGFGGSCFRKDILSLVYLAESAGLDLVGEYWRQVIKMNDYARDRFANRVIRSLNNTLVGKKITILGYAFKKNTSDTREPPALEMIRTLLEERPGEIAVYDPCCNPLVIQAEICQALGQTPATPTNVSVYNDGHAACRGSTAIVIATEFDEFSNRKPRATVASTATITTAVLSTPSGPSGLSAPSDPSGPSAPSKAATAEAVSTLRPSPFRDPRPFSSASRPGDLELLALHRHLIASGAGGDDPLNRLQPEPACESDCPDCRQLESSTEAADAGATGPTGEYKAKARLDWAVIAANMSQPKWLFDGRGVIDAKEIAKLGVKFESVGRQSGLPAPVN